ncbi:MAG: 2,3-bisphosphoglycerate-independent phosphoglycerate mutase, partial [Clostridiaceae bacterium]|nr:2,3-bisphosphoglycerate-independent phosphoglycerate mutase [Clostridiaceae bacterium]
MMNDFNKLVLVIMDGVGVSKQERGDAVKAASKPVLDKLMAENPNTIIKAHGVAVGLPDDGDMGNSEVGHNALGCGQIYAQGAKLVNQSIASGRIFESAVWQELVNQAKSNDGSL